MKSRLLVPALILPLAFGGCAVEQQGRVTTGALRDPSEKASGKSREDTLKAFCAQRHIDYQTGKAPGGATTEKQKASDDRLCEAIGRQG
jgi:hypothetical protein